MREQMSKTSVVDQAGASGVLSEGLHCQSCGRDLRLSAGNRSPLDLIWIWVRQPPIISAEVNFRHTLPDSTFSPLPTALHQMLYTVLSRHRHFIILYEMPGT